MEHFQGHCCSRFFKNELALAIRDIKDEYDYIANQGRQDMESWYKLKVSEVQGNANRALMESNYQREEVKRMRDNIGSFSSRTPVDCCILS